MLTGFLLALREGAEAALLVGLLSGVLRRMCRPDCMAALWLGVAAGAASSALAAGLLHTLGVGFVGDGEAIYEGTVGIAASALLTGMIFWMRGHAVRANDAAKTDMQVAVRSGRSAVFALTFVAVVREGIELALFLNAAAFRSDAAAIVAGAALGVLVSVAGGWLLFATAVRVNVQRFFQVSSAVLLLLAAGLIAHAVGEFVEIGWIPAFADPIWNTTGWLPETSAVGAILETLFGYTSAPTLSEVVAYALFLIAAGIGWRHSRASGRTAG